MGRKLVEMYKEAAAIGSIRAQMRLAMLTLISSTKAEQEPDSPENLKKFRDALSEIEKEFK